MFNHKQSNCTPNVTNNNLFVCIQEPPRRPVGAADPAPSSKPQKRGRPLTRPGKHRHAKVSNKTHTYNICAYYIDDCIIVFLSVSLLYVIILYLLRLCLQLLLIAAHLHHCLYSSIFIIQPPTHSHTRRDFIYPLFIHESDRVDTIASMPGTLRHSLASMMKEVEEAVSFGVVSFILFPKVSWYGIIIFACACRPWVYFSSQSSLVVTHVIYLLTIYTTMLTCILFSIEIGWW